MFYNSWDNDLFLCYAKSNILSLELNNTYAKWTPKRSRNRREGLIPRSVPYRPCTECDWFGTGLCAFVCKHHIHINIYIYISVCTHTSVCVRHMCVSMARLVFLFSSFSCSKIVKYQRRTSTGELCFPCFLLKIKLNLFTYPSGGWRSTSHIPHPTSLEDVDRDVDLVFGIWHFGGGVWSLTLYFAVWVKEQKGLELGKQLGP